VAKAGRGGMTIDLFADIACPWCYIGERRLKRALESGGVEADVRWRPVQLQPGLPREGMPWGDFVDRTFGGWQRARRRFAHVQAAGASEGIRFDFERTASAPNTRDAHRLMLLAQDEGRGWEMAEALFSAYFSGGRDVGDPAVLADLAARAGVDGGRARRVLAGDEYAARVDESLEAARAGGVQGVPLFIFDERYTVSGAQPLAVFEQVLEKAAAG
jgi:predicted DsbA family dithiol-disulfide isomerase